MGIRYSPRTGLPNTYQVGPYERSHWYLQWGGKLPGAEQWSCGIRLAPTSPGAPVVTPTHLAAAVAAVSAYHADGGVNINQGAKLSFVKLNWIGTDGKQGPTNTNQTIVADIPGSSTLTPPPNQVAMVVTLTTLFTRGLGHAGRFYLPLPGYAVGADGRFAAAGAALVGTATDTLIAALNAIDAGVMNCAVMSRKAGAPTYQYVTGARVGRVYDTQRRRRRSVVEDYQ